MNLEVQASGISCSFKSQSKKFDPTFPHVKAFLEKFFFEQVALFLSAARTSVHRGAATWVDLAIFQCEASHGMEFDAYI
jgi:hypothetical protein